MKRQQTIIAIFALIIFALGAGNANAQFGDFINKAKQEVKKVKQEVEKTKQEIKQLGNPGGGKTTPTRSSKKQNNVETWITFSKRHTRSNENRNLSMNTFGCGDPIFATVNFREPVDNSGGFTVSMLVDGELVVKEQMSGGSETSVNETIHIELIPADDADMNYPKVTLEDGKTKLTLDELLRERIVPKQFRRVVELLQLVKNNDNFYSKDEQIARRKTDELLSFVSSKIITFYNVNDKPKTHRFTKAQLQRAFARKDGAAFDLLINLGNNYAMPYPQYSAVRYDSFRNNVVIEISDDWRLTFARENGELKLTRLEYLQVEGD